jgi:hypothetical protein
VAEKPVPAPELTHLHASINRDLNELRSRWARWTTQRRAAGMRHGFAERLGAHPEDVVSVAFRTFRAVRLVMDALGEAAGPAAERVGDKPAQASSSS